MGMGGGGYNAGGYSDVSSHGTYAQGPLSVPSHGHEAYGMREMGPGPGVGEIYDPNAYAAGGAAAAAAGAAGIGVARARSTRDGGAYAAALADGNSPYPAFAVPGGNNNNYHYQKAAPGHRGGHSPEVLEAAGLMPGVGAGAGLTRGPSSANHHQQQGQYPQRQSGQYPSPQPMDYANLGRNMSQISRNGSGAGAPESFYSQPSGDSHMAYGAPPPMPHLQQHREEMHDDDEDDDDAYGGMSSRSDPAVPPGNLPNPFSSSPTTPGSGKERAREEFDAESSGDEEDETPARRVLKVRVCLLVYREDADFFLSV